jgi:hypothetical protein
MRSTPNDGSTCRNSARVAHGGGASGGSRRCVMTLVDPVVPNINFMPSSSLLNPPIFDRH